MNISLGIGLYNETLSYLAASEIKPKRKIKSPNSFLNYSIY